MVARVCLVSSGTGGHLWPAIALGQRLRAAGHETWLVTEGRDVERDLLARAGLEADDLPIRAGGALAMSHAAWRARRMLRGRRAEAVVCTGGRTSLAVGLAAGSLGLPLFVLEQNAVTGRANRVLGRFAERVYLGLPNPRGGRRSVLTGTPLRPDFGCRERAAARSDLGVAPDRPLVLVTGGSQGAEILNTVVPGALCAAAVERGVALTVLHLTGAGRDAAVRARYAAGAEVGLEAFVRPLAVDMATLYAAADLVVCRGGGCTVSELCKSARPAIIVPYPHHRDRQQLRNAEVLSRVGAARVVEQAELTVARLARELSELLADPAELAAMGERAGRIAPADPCAAIVADLGRAVTRRRPDGPSHAHRQ